MTLPRAAADCRLAAPRLRRAALAQAGLALVLVPTLLRAHAPTAPRVAPDIAAARHAAAAQAVAHALVAAPAPGNAVRLRGTALEDNRLTLDFSREALDLAPGSAAFEQFSRSVHRAAAEELRAACTHFEIHTLIEGVPLDRLLAAADRPALARAPAFVRPAAPPSTQPLAARRIALSPGHGYYQNPAGAWVLQRSYWQGIVEDFINHDMITLLRDELAAAGADVHPTRNLNRAAGNGESGFPRWQEAARYHVKALGADPSVWNEAGFTHLDQDIRCRPRWANSIGAEILVSLHNNGGGGTGTETLYDTNNGFGPESRRLAEAVHNRVIAAIRRDYQPAWTDRRVQGFNGNYGENRLATRPSILIEVAFMDRPTPDNAALQDDAFKRLVARALREGIQEYFDGPAALPPEAPSTLIATAAPGGGAITLAWRDLSSTETGFRIERRPAGPGTDTGAWSPLATVGVNVTTYTDTTAAAGTTYVYRVAAVNAAGSSALFTNEATVLGAPVAVAAAPSRPTPWLANVSLRTTLAAGQGVTVGLVIAGGARQVLVRAAGPALGAFGVAAAMADPRLELFRGQARQAENNDWPAAYAPVMAALGAFPFATASRDAALVQTVDGPHTALAGGTAAGAVLVEVYDSGGGTGRLVNLSARHRVGTGADLLIAGFHLAGSGPARLLLRAVGPALTALGVAGVLANPRLEIFDAAGTKLAENDDWEAALAPAFAAAGAFALPADSRDAALVLTLAAGRGYTAQVSGVGNTTGEALIEVYELP